MSVLEMWNRRKKDCFRAVFVLLLAGTMTDAFVTQKCRGNYGGMCPPQVAIIAHRRLHVSCGKKSGDVHEEYCTIATKKSDRMFENEITNDDSTGHVQMNDRNKTKVNQFSIENTYFIYCSRESYKTIFSYIFTFRMLYLY